jgi:DNA sulfur modification protein DndD
MIITSLKVNNIRSYVGTHELRFAEPGARNVTLFNGVNGAGKTSLFIALNWVLFGAKFPFQGQLVSDQLSALSDGSALGSVSLSFSHLDREYFLAREMRAETTADGQLIERESGLELFSFDAGGQSRLERFPDTALRTMLPEAIRSFFFFDGDKISDFARPGRERDLEITQAVNDVLQLELVDRSSRHLSALGRDIQKNIAKKGSPIAKQLEAKRVAVEKSIEVSRGNIEGLELERDAAESRLQWIDKELSEVQLVAEKSKRRSLLDKELVLSDKRIIDIKQQMMHRCTTYVASAVTSKLTSASSYLESKRKKREIPSNYKDQFLKDLLAANRCICDRELSPGTVEREHVQALLDVSMPGGIQERAMELRSSLLRVLRVQEGAISFLVAADNELSNAVQDRNEIENEVRSIAAEIKGVDEKDVVAKELDREATRRGLRELDVKIAANRQQIDTLLGDVSRLKREFDDEVAKESRLNELRELSAFADEAAQAFENIRATLINDLRIDLSEVATEIFKTFTWKRDYFERISVGEDYLITMLDRNARDLRAGMSMGETQLLSLAFMLSMISISEYAAPLVIDMPVARLSRDVRVNLLQGLPRLSNQLVLFCTDLEMDKEARAALGGSVGIEYDLVFENAMSHAVERVLG